MAKIPWLFLCSLFFFPLLVRAQGNLFKKDISYGRTSTEVRDMNLTSDGHVILGSSSPKALVLVKMKLNGDTAWVKSFDSKGGLICYAAREHVNNTYITAGAWRNPSTGIDNGFLIRHDSLGNIIWSLASSANGETRWWDAAVGPDSAIAAVGYWDAGEDHCLVSKFDASGKLLWSKEGGRGKHVEYESVIFDKSGNIIAVGNTSGGGSVVTKFSSNGTVLWNKVSSANTFSCKAVNILSSGNILVCGKVRQAGFNNIILHKFSPNGNLLLAKVYWANASCEPFDIQLASDNEIVIYGEASVRLATRNNNQNVLMQVDTLGKINWSYSYGDTLQHESNACGLYTPDSAHWIGSHVGIHDKSIIFKTDKAGQSSCLRYPLVFTDSTHKTTYSTGPTIRNYSLTVKSISWGKGSIVYKDTLECSKNLCELTSSAKVISNFNGLGVSCHGEKNGMALVTAQNGTMPIQYTWSANAQSQTTDTAKGLAAGKYYVTITDDNKCRAVDSVIITQPSVLMASVVNSTKSGCNRQDAIAIANASGGAGGYSYQWDTNANLQTTDTANGLGNGKYWVAVKDANGCLDSASVDIINHENPEVQVGAVKDATCFGDCNGEATVLVTKGKSPFTYQWDAAAQNQTTQTASALCAGSYWVVATDSNNCKDSIQATVVEPMALDTSVTKGVNGLTSNALGVDYQWLDCGNSFSEIAGATSQTFMPSASGVYAVLVSNDSCSDTSMCYNVLVVGKEKPGLDNSSVEVWPNPANGLLNVRVGGTEKVWQMKMVDALGKERLEIRLESNGVYELSTSHLASGVYRMFLENGRDQLTVPVLIR